MRQTRCRNELATLILGATLPVPGVPDALVSDERRSEPRRHGKAEGNKFSLNLPETWGLDCKTFWILF